MHSRQDRKTIKDEILDLFKQGDGPKEISKKIGKTFKYTMDSLYIMVGEGKIRRSDIWFSISPKIRREIIDKVVHGENEIAIEGLEALISNLDEYKIYKNLQNARVDHGDMYELISDIELILHRSIKNVLVKTYGNSESEWWRQGVPQNIQNNCVKRRDKDDDPAKEIYCYTTIIELKKILSNNWELFEKVLPKNIIKDNFLIKLETINQIRNRVMHPSKGYDFTPKDFETIYDFHKEIDINNWQDKRILK